MNTERDRQCRTLDICAGFHGNRFKKTGHFTKSQDSWCKIQGITKVSAPQPLEAIHIEIPWYSIQRLSIYLSE